MSLGDNETIMSYLISPERYIVIFFLYKFVFQLDYSTESFYVGFHSQSLTYSFPVHDFCTPWKHQKTLWVSDVFRSQTKGAMGKSGLMKYWQSLLILMVTQPLLCCWVNLIFVSSPHWIFISTMTVFLNGSPMEELLIGLTPESFVFSWWVKQFIAGWWDKVYIV